ncbi:MAG: sigma-54-dependent Fis family transcriptional regulator [Pseudomonadaceae bacterium]|nr:MAG: sigma-54-dependent Fis family transcriptional regulator [Pseudomonadaceae bacterium]
MPNNESILLVEDDASLRELLAEELEAEGYQVAACGDAESAVEHLQEHTPSLVVSDLRLPGADGLSLVSHCSRLQPPPSILIITAFGSVQQAVQALKVGADDFLTKPLEMDHFLLTVRRLLDNRQLRDEVQQYRELLAADQFHGIIGQSPAMQQLFHQIRQIATAEGPVLVQGESGTGKELVARALHEQSSRAGKPYLTVNCGGIPSELMESEFFGHAAGAFTGARQQRAGLFQQANGGTLMLDELGEMPLTLQAKLLRALQDGHIRPVGSDHEIQVDVRVIGATNRNLTAAVAAGEFREDLFYRLETFALQIPPLRQRAGDVMLLAKVFLAQVNSRQNTRIRGFSDAACALLERYTFPGNVRELQNAVERAATFCTSEWIDVPELPQRIRDYSGTPLSADLTATVEQNMTSNPIAALTDDLQSLEQVQRLHIQRVLQSTGGNKRKAAEILGITRRTLYRWLE